ncbi:glycoside hydrolase family 2 TIM barrel-domain containing protein [Naasia sp. SYSU D00057]|uniref:glycoside hydrolase family 2 TIM barrel-domain containing protein n=1 Tax=Naasia sp. SYSU D00057 TaxID=2817380 RepID=UPI001B30B926|nr:glycoside hydrolase family 2 TIM barrel-domain containing protein [Naasia sp. SYSU D00057]
MTVTPFNDGWSYRRPLGPFAAADGAKVDPVEVRLPHDALRDAERRPDVPGKGAGAFHPHGAFTYLKTFTVPAEWEGRLVRLELQGAFRRAQVFLNDEFAGNRADGYARFFVDLTPYLKYGQDNELRVEVRSGEDSRWYSGTGLHRPVLLHVDAPVHVVPDGVTVSTVRIEDDQAVVDVVTTVANAGLSTRTVTVSTSVTGPDGAEVERDSTPSTLAPGEQAVVRQRLYLRQPALWSPDSPALHTARVGLGGDPADEVVVPFGIRTVTVDPRKGLRINGEPVLLRGACLHHDNGPLGAAAIGRAEERRIELLKAAGFNAIRTAHNPASPAMLDACDRLGVLVMDEAFDMWTRFKTPYDYAADFPQWWAADLEAMVAKDRNHPSVIMYSIGNEIIEVGSPHGSRWARRMAEHLRALDPTRLVTNGINPFLAVIDELPSILAAAGGGLNAAMSSMDDAFSAIGSSEAVSRRTAESSAALDVLGLNYSESRYDLDQELFPHRVLVGSETFPSQIGRLWPLVKENPNVIGDFTWTGWDYLGEVGIGATAYAEDPEAVAALEREYPYLTAWCGDLDLTGSRRPISYYREIVFGLRTEPYVAVLRPEHHGHTVTQRSPWAWSDSVSSWTWPGFEGKPITVEVYADADEVALLLDGEHLASARVGESRPMLAALETEYRPGELVAVAYRGGVETGRTTLATARGAVRLTAEADRSQLRDDDSDLAYVAIELRDEAGRLNTSEERPVSVEVTGAGVLAGMGSANPKTEERFDSSTWRTFDGRALAVVRPTGAGEIRVTVTSEGLEPVELALTVG